MTVGYVVADLDAVIKGKVTQYIESLAALRDAVRAEASKYIPSLTLGGITPEENQYAEVPLRPEQFTGVDGNKLSGSFRQDVTSTGWNNNYLTADPSEAGELGKNYVFGVVGLAIMDSVALLSEIQLHQSDYTFPVIDLEESVSKSPCAIIFDVSDSQAKRLVFNPDTKFALDVFFTGTGYQSIKPLGIAEIPKNTAINKTF